MIYNIFLIFLKIFPNTFMNFIDPSTKKKINQSVKKFGRSKMSHKNIITAGAVKALPTKKNAPGNVLIVAEYIAVYIGT